MLALEWGRRREGDSAEVELEQLEEYAEVLLCELLFDEDGQERLEELELELGCADKSVKGDLLARPEEVAEDGHGELEEGGVVEAVEGGEDELMDFGGDEMMLDVVVVGVVVEREEPVCPELGALLFEAGAEGDALLEEGGLHFRRDCDFEGPVVDE